MGPFNSNDMNANQPKLIVGSVWQLRHSKGFRVKVIKLEGNMVHIEHLQRQHNRHSQNDRKKVVSRYGFLQVYLAA
jgi:hypothetical protein